VRAGVTTNVWHVHPSGGRGPVKYVGCARVFTVHIFSQFTKRSQFTKTSINTVRTALRSLGLFGMNAVIARQVLSRGIRDEGLYFAAAVVCRHKCPPFGCELVINTHEDLLPINGVNVIQWAYNRGYPMHSLGVYSAMGVLDNEDARFVATAYRRCTGASLETTKWITKNVYYLDSLVYNDDPETFRWLLPVVSLWGMLDIVVKYGNLENLHTLWRYTDVSRSFTNMTFLLICAYGRLDILKYMYPWLRETQKSHWREDLAIDADIALRRGHYELFLWMVEKGVPINYASSIQLVRERGRDDMVQKLESYCNYAMDN
jgi:hypothetical protein